MENERRIDRTTSMGMDEHRLSDILHASQIKATDIYETPPQIIWIDNSTIATLGNFSASTGKAKSKKDVQRLCACRRIIGGETSIELPCTSARRQTAYSVRRYGTEPFPLPLGIGAYIAAGRVAHDDRSGESRFFSACVNIRRRCVSRSSTMRCANRKATDWSSSTAFAT